MQEIGELMKRYLIYWEDKGHYEGNIVCNLKNGWQLKGLVEFIKMQHQEAIGNVIIKFMIEIK